MLSVRGGIVRLIVVIVSVFFLSGCAGTSYETADMYRAKTEATVSSNQQQVDVTVKIIEAVRKIRTAEIEAKKEVDIARIENPPERPELEPTGAPSITGDHNTVVIGSHGVDIDQGVGGQPDPLGQALLRLTGRGASLVPSAPVLQSAGAQAIKTGGAVLNNVIDKVPWAIGAIGLTEALTAGTTRDSSVVLGDDNTGRVTTRIHTENAE